MKKIISAIIIASAAMSMTACAGRNETVYYAPGPKLKICATTSPVYSMTADVISTRQNIALEQITKPGENPSGRTLTPEETEYFSKFNACIISGMGYDDAIAEQLKKANPNIKICISSEGINPVMSADGKQNPYVWTSPVSQAKMCKNIARFMINIDCLQGQSEKKEASYGTIESEYGHRCQFIFNRLAGESATVAQQNNRTDQNKAPKDDKTQAKQSDENNWLIAKNPEGSATDERILKIKTFIACNTSKTYSGTEKYDYLMRDCGITRDDSGKSAVIISDESSSSDGSLKLQDIMKEKEIMPDTCGQINLSNAAEAKRVFGAGR
ncbi:MAG: zinc ABC transporter substrate-binding protein [bacterium]|nr:zinc ABC transporter substrate-binding protein [bacterium]